MYKTEGNNNFLRGDQRWPVLSNSTGQGASGATPKQNQIEKENKKVAAIAGNSNKKHSSCKDKVRGKAAKRGKGISGDDTKEEKGSGSSDHEIHIWTERERRKKMRNLFSNLHTLLPQLPPKVWLHLKQKCSINFEHADKSTIVDEAVGYIKNLEQTLEKLEEEKREKATNKASCSREAFLADQVSSINYVGNTSADKLSNSRTPASFSTWSSPNIVLNVCNDVAQFSICSAKKAGLFVAVCYVMEKHNIEVLSSHISSDHFNRRFYMIQARVNGGANQIGEAEEIYRQAADEIIGWMHT